MCPWKPACYSSHHPDSNKCLRVSVSLCHDSMRLRARLLKNAPRAAEPPAPAPAPAPVAAARLSPALICTFPALGHWPDSQKKLIPRASAAEICWWPERRCRKFASDSGRPPVTCRLRADQSARDHPRGGGGHTAALS